MKRWQLYINGSPCYVQADTKAGAIDRFIEVYGSVGTEPNYKYWSSNHNPIPMPQAKS